MLSHSSKQPRLDKYRGSTAVNYTCIYTKVCTVLLHVQCLPALWLRWFRCLHSDRLGSHNCQSIQLSNATVSLVSIQKPYKTKPLAAPIFTAHNCRYNPKRTLSRHTVHALTIVWRKFSSLKNCNSVFWFMDACQ